MPIGDIEDKARTQCRVMFPDDEEKQKECVPIAMKILQPSSTKLNETTNKQPIQTIEEKEITGKGTDEI